MTYSEISDRLYRSGHPKRSKEALSVKVVELKKKGYFEEEPGEKTITERNPWSSDEDAFIRNNFRKSSAELAGLLARAYGIKRTPGAVRNRLYALGFSASDKARANGSGLPVRGTKKRTMEITIKRPQNAFQRFILRTFQSLMS